MENSDFIVKFVQLFASRSKRCIQIGRAIAVLMIFTHILRYIPVLCVVRELFPSETFISLFYPLQIYVYVSHINLTPCAWSYFWRVYVSYSTSLAISKVEEVCCTSNQGPILCLYICVLGAAGIQAYFSCRKEGQSITSFIRLFNLLFSLSRCSSESEMDDNPLSL